MCPGKATEESLSEQERKWGEGESGGKPRDGEAAPTGMFAWKGAGVSGAGDALGSIQKSQEATKDGRGQVTSYFPSSAL